MEANFVDVPISTLGEGPCWDAAQQKLYWVDILEKKIHILDYVSKEIHSIELDQYVGAVVLNETGGLMAALQHGFHTIDLQSGAVEKLADPEGGLPDNRFNDGKCDPAGRFWAGTMSLINEEKAGALYRLDGDGSIHSIINDVSISNGLAWSPDESIMYYIDTPTRKINAFDYNKATGEISNRRTVIEVPEGEGAPDGMSIDVEGKLWIAHWGGWQLARWDPDTGQKLDSVQLPAAQVTSCAFAGPEMNELFITSAHAGLSEQQRAEQPLAGGLFTIKVDVPGVPVAKYHSSK